MKICYVGQFHRTSVGEPEIAYALEKLGHEVVKVSEGSSLTVVKEKVRDCDILLFAKFRTKNTENERLQFLEELKIPSVCGVFDLYWGL